MTDKRDYAIDTSPCRSTNLDALLSEYERNCKKNIRQNPERLSHWIEADPKDILIMIDRIRHLEAKVEGVEDHLDVTIGALRLASEKASTLMGLWEDEEKRRSILYKMATIALATNQDLCDQHDLIESFEEVIKAALGDE